MNGFCAILLCLTGLSGYSSQLTADVADWLPADTAMVLVIDNLEPIVETINGIGWFESGQFESLKEMLCDEDFGLLDSSDFREIQASIEELVEHRELVNRIHLVVNPSESSGPQFTCILTVDEDANEQVKELIFDVLEKIRTVIQSEGSTELAESEDADEGRQEDLSRGDHVVCRSFGNHLVFSNDSRYCRELGERIEKRDSRSALSSKRSYQQIRAICDKQRADYPVFFYLNPEASRSLITLFDESDWGMYQINEFRALGGAVYFEDREQDLNENLPFIHGFAAITHTLPAPNYVRILDTYAQLEDIPPFAFPLIEVSVTSQDSQQHYEICKEIVDSEHGAGTYDERVQQRYANDVRDYFRDVLPRTNDWYGFRYESRFGRTEVMSLQKIADQAAMERYVRGLVEMTNTVRKGDRFLESEEDGIKFWALSRKARKQKLSRLQEILERGNEDSQTEITVDTVPSEGYALSSEWYLLGDMHDIRKQLDFTGHRERDFAKPINSRRKQLVKMHGIPGAFRLEVTSPWIDYMSQIEKPVVEHVRKKYKSNLRKRKELIREFYRNKDISFAVESPEDTQVAVGYLAAKMVMETFKQQMVVYGKSQGQLKIGFGLFADERQTDND